MINTKVGHFPPAKQLGMILHGIIIIILAGASIWGFTNLTNAQMGPMFVSYLLTGLLAFAPIPFLGYRAYSLFKADYYIDRDSLAILWGLRIEDIPLTDIEWVPPNTSLRFHPEMGLRSPAPLHALQNWAASLLPKRNQSIHPSSLHRHGKARLP